MRGYRSILPLLAACALAGCAAPKALYSWGPYEPQVYEYFKGEAPEKQVLVLEQHMADAREKGESLPPGFHAHLGLLYERLGRDAEFRAMLDLEKKHFPESSAYLDSLNRRAGR